MLRYGFLISSLALAVLSDQTTEPLSNNGTPQISGTGWQNASDLEEVKLEAQIQYYLNRANVKSVSELTIEKIRQIFDEDHGPKELSDVAEKFVQEYTQSVLENLKNHKLSMSFDKFVETSDYVNNLTDADHSKLKASFKTWYTFYLYARLEAFKTVLRNKPRKCSPKLEKFLERIGLTCEGKKLRLEAYPEVADLSSEVEREIYLKLNNLRSIDEVQPHHVRQMLNDYEVKLESLNTIEEAIVNKYVLLKLESLKSHKSGMLYFSDFVDDWEYINNIPREYLIHLKDSMGKFEDGFYSAEETQVKYKKLTRQTMKTILKNNPRDCTAALKKKLNEFKLTCEGKRLAEKMDPTIAKTTKEWNIEMILNLCHLTSVNEIQESHVRLLTNTFIANLNSLNEDEEKLVDEYVKLELQYLKNENTGSPGLWVDFIEDWEDAYNIVQDRFTNLKASIEDYEKDVKIKKRKSESFREAVRTVLKYDQEDCKNNPEYYQQNFNLNCNGSDVVSESDQIGVIDAAAQGSSSIN